MRGQSAPTNATPSPHARLEECPHCDAHLRSAARHCYSPITRPNLCRVGTIPNASDSAWRQQGGPLCLQAVNDKWNWPATHWRQSGRHSRILRAGSGLGTLDKRWPPHSWGCDGQVKEGNAPSENRGTGHPPKRPFTYISRASGRPAESRFLWKAPWRPATVEDCFGKIPANL